MQTKYIKEQCNIYEYPKTFNAPSGTITIGDLHGNSVKFLFFLIQNGVIGFKKRYDLEKTYAFFVDLYRQFAEVVDFRYDKMDQIKELNLVIREHENNITFIDFSYCDLVEIERELKETLELKQSIQNELNEGLKNFASLEELIIHFRVFCKTLEIKNNLVSIRLLGDEVADRGCCDFFTLVLLNFIQANHVNVTILLSNHGIEFITAYEHLSRKEDFIPLNALKNAQKTSFFGLSYLLEDKIITAKELLQLVNSCYKPTLKIIDYTINKDGIRLFTHAPVDFNIIIHLANELGVVYSDFTTQALGITIDKINTVFQQIVLDNDIHLYLDILAYPGQSLLHTLEENIDTWSFLYVTWNRFDNIKDTYEKRPYQLNGYSIEYIHCHDDYISELPHVFNLNTLCGKDPSATEREKIEKANRVLNDKMVIERDKTASKRYLLRIFDYTLIESTDVQLKERYTVDEIDEEFKQFISSASELSTQGELLDESEYDLNQTVFKR